MAMTAWTDEVARLYGEQRRITGELNAALAAMPEESVERDYRFVRTDGAACTLGDLFGEHDELLVVHNMGRSCRYCTMWADGFIGMYRHISRRCGFVLSSPDEPAVLGAFAEERGWTFPCVSLAGNGFAADMGFADGEGRLHPGVSVFRRDGEGGVFRVSKCAFGPGDRFCPAWHFFSLLPGGDAGFKPE